MTPPLAETTTSRYVAEPAARLEQAGCTLLVNERRPGWAVLNRSALRLLDCCEDPQGRTLTEIHRGFAVSSTSVEEVSELLSQLEAAGLLQRLPSEPPDERSTPCKETAIDREYRVEHLYIELLARCNLRCIHCYMEGAPQRDEVLDPDEVVELLRAFRATGGRYVTLSGGEPLLYRHFERVAREAVGQGLQCTVITNGTVLRERQVALLAELDLGVAISLDGVSAEVNDPIRGPGTFEKAMRGINLAVERLGPERLTLSMTPNGMNLDDLSGLFELARCKGIRRLNLSLIERVGRGADNWSQLGLSLAERERFVESVFDAALQHVGEVEVDFNDTRNILDVFATDRAPDSIHPLWRGVRVDSIGDCYPSSFGSAPPFLLGNVRQSPLAEILASPILEELYETLIDRFRRIPQCSTCDWRQLCRGGGVTSSYYATGSLLTPDSYCSGYLRAFPRIATAIADLTVPHHDAVDAVG